jgi:hypothetical protein
MKYDVHMVHRMIHHLKKQCGERFEYHHRDVLESFYWQLPCPFCDQNFFFSVFLVHVHNEAHHARHSREPDNKRDKDPDNVQDASMADNKVEYSHNKDIRSKVVHSAPPCNTGAHSNSQMRNEFLVKNTMHHKDQNKNDLDDNSDLCIHDGRPRRHPYILHILPHAQAHPHNHILLLLSQLWLLQIVYNNWPE